jgi:hypothetical protein
MAGALGRVFGACANGMAPDDGRVVALTHGCGAHSETVVETQESSYAGMAVEDDEFDVVERRDDRCRTTRSCRPVDAPEDAGVPGVDDPPLDDVVDGPRPRPGGSAAELAGGLADVGRLPRAVLRPDRRRPAELAGRPGRRRERLTRSTPVRPSAAPRALPALLRQRT